MLLGTLAAVGTPISAQDASRRDSAVCELLLETKYIESVELEDAAGRRVLIRGAKNSAPRNQTDNGVVHECIGLALQPRVSLAPGQYRILDVEIAGGYAFDRIHAQPSNVLVLTPEKPCRPALGPPFTPSVRVERLGDRLQFDPMLLDADGRAYKKRSFTRSDRDNAPEISIAQGEHRLGTVAASENWNVVGWRVPAGVDGPLQVVASIDTGELGQREGPPVVFSWRWWNHFPSLPLWIALLVLLTVVSSIRRDVHPWLLLIPVALPLLLWSFLATLRPFASSAPGFAASINYVVVSGTLACGIVWLLGPWLAIGNRVVTLLIALAIMGLLGLFAYGCYFSSWVGFLDQAYFYVCSVSVVPAGMMLAGRLCCREGYSRPTFLAWLLVSNAGIIAGFFLIGLVYVCMNCGREGGMVVFAFLIMGIPMAILWTILVSLLSLSFWGLTLWSPFHRDCFERLFYIPPERTGASVRSRAERERALFG